MKIFLGIFLVLGLLALSNTQIQPSQVGPTQKWAMYEIVPETQEQADNIKELCNFSPNVTLFGAISGAGIPVNLLIKHSEVANIREKLQNVGIQSKLLDKYVKISFSKPLPQPRLMFWPEVSCDYTWRKEIDWNSCQWSGCWTWFVPRADMCAKDFGGQPEDGSGYYQAIQDGHGPVASNCGFLGAGHKTKCCKCKRT